ncbi:perforin-1.1 [Scleropages formosus]|uniref:Perforin-1-like n=1 Tax=Scleropages formosus TaxID=113540 RepID=A0A8C9UWT9_SCLFO|nr:perforin-1-like [Scleropages formosus]
MLLSVICSWVGLALLSLPTPTSPYCVTVRGPECDDVEFAPGSTLAGEGFDITKMQRKGAYVIDTSTWKRRDKTCTICHNPYLQKKQKLPLSIVDWRPNHQCSLKIASALHESSEALVSSSTKSVQNNWESSLELSHKNFRGSLMLAGTNSKLAEYSMEKTKKDRFSFTSHHVSCRYYSYRLSSSPSIHPEFQQAMKKLPKKYNQNSKAHYYKFIDIFGTHYITKVDLGGSISTVTSIRQCEAALQGLSVDEVKMCLDVEAAANVGEKVNMKTKAQHCQEDRNKLENRASFSSKFNDRFTEIQGGHTTEPELMFSPTKNPEAYKEWMLSLQTIPDLISYSLDSLHELLPPSNPLAQNLQRAISHYILERALWKNCSEPCPTGVKTNPKDSCVCSCHNNPGVTPNCCPTKRGQARVKVTIQRATDLWGDYNTGTDGYVKVSHMGVPVGRTRIIYNTNHPYWGDVFDMGLVVLSAGDSVKLEVWDEDNKWDDDLLGTCNVKLAAGVKEDICGLNHGQLYYKVEVECAPSLGGGSCSDYVGSPLNWHMQKAYVSRNALPVPSKILEKLGVVFDNGTALANRSRSDR